MRKFYLALFFILGTIVSYAQDAPFITTWEVVNYDLDITIPTQGYGYDYTIDFGDGVIESNVNGNITHTYEEAGIYTVSISGDFPRIRFGNLSNDSNKIKSVEQWGDIQWENMESGFSGCSNALSFNQQLNNWDVSNVTNMSYMFLNTLSFNQPLDNWDVSNVTNIKGMFSNALSFNQQLNNWDVSSVTNMENLFKGTSYFNQPLNNWDVSNVTNMAGVFKEAVSFNQFLNNWDVSNVTHMNEMFSGNILYNQPLSNWEVSNVTIMYDMFMDNRSFNQDLSNWNFNNDVTLGGFIDNSGLNVSNYELLLNQFQNLNLQDKYFLAGGLMYCNNTVHDFLTEDLGWTISGDAFLYNCDVTLTSGAFVTRWEVFSNDLSVTIPTVGNENYNYTVDFGDGTVLYNQNESATHTYTSEGVYQISISGEYPQRVSSFYEREKLRSVEQWGSIEWSSMKDAFKGCYNMVINAIDVPNLNEVTDMSNMFSGAVLINSSLNSWDVSSVTNMENLFKGAIYFNQPLSNWDVSNVINMSGMFEEASSFNKPLNNWDVSSVVNMENMFYGGYVSFKSSFNQPLNNWNVSNVTNMKGMFYNSPYFNQPLNNWDVSSVTNMENMFRLGDLSDFTGTSYFNQPLNNWDVGNVINMTGMFFRQPSFNQSIDDWDVSNVIYMGSMFRDTNYNKSLNNWDVSNVTQMPAMFKKNKSFNKPLNNWNTSSLINTREMFLGCKSFNQPLNNWNVSNIEGMEGMFQDALNFNQDLSNWDFNLEVRFFYNAFFDDDNLGFIDNCGLDIYNYDILLASFEELNLENKTLIATSLKYCNQGVRNELLNNFNWEITDDTLSNDCIYNYFVGNVRYDENNNSCDESDLPAINFPVKANNGTNDFLSFTNSTGNFSLNLFEATYSVQVYNLPDYYQVSPETSTITYSGFGNVEQVDFCITANQAIEDLNITLLPISEARPGFEANYQLVVNNLGTQTVTDAEVNLTFDDEMQSFISASQNLSSSTDSELNFELTDLPPFGTQTIDLTMQTFEPPTVNGGDELNFITTVTPEENEYTPEDNAFNFEQEVVNAFDPNDKQVLQGEEIFLEEADEYLVYIIRFQNTGSASAINVRLEDDLDAKLDWSTIQMLSSSDDYRVEITDGNHVEFFFDDINLRYESENEPESHGFVAYKIKPRANVEVGDVISGNASIYFDYNEPIITNTVSTEIIEPLGIAKYDLKGKVSLYPNPAKNILNIKTVSSVEVEQVAIFNIQGQEILSIKKNLKSINLENLSEGMYILQVKTNQGNLNQQLIKE